MTIFTGSMKVNIGYALVLTRHWSDPYREHLAASTIHLGSLPERDHVAAVAGLGLRHITTGE